MIKKGNHAVIVHFVKNALKNVILLKANSLVLFVMVIVTAIDVRTESS
jgi:hypothetical protein